MHGAQQSLLIALELRRDGLDDIAERIRTALGDAGDAADQAINQIAGQMQVVPRLRRDLQRARAAAHQVTRCTPTRSAARRSPRRSSCREISWLQPAYVADAARPAALEPAATATRRQNEPTGPGLHGTGLDSHRLRRHDAAARRRPTG